MTKKKSGFWTFIFSLLPGAAEMYMGFMKMGVSLMGLFFGESSFFHAVFDEILHIPFHPQLLQKRAADHSNDQTQQHIQHRHAGAKHAHQ